MTILRVPAGAPGLAKSFHIYDGLYMYMYYMYYLYIYIYVKMVGYSVSNVVEGSLEVKLPTIWTDEKQSRAEAERRGRLVERRSEEKE